jgi:hypothetical protein
MLICCRIGLNLRFESISQELFPLPTLSSKLKDLAKVLTNGVGFFLIRGLDPKQYSSEINLIMYLGISSYIGDKRGVQDERGNMLRKYTAIEQFPCFGLAAYFAECIPELTRYPVHLTDLGSQAGPDNERQAPYSNVGQVSKASAWVRMQHAN